MMRGWRALGALAIFLGMAGAAQADKAIIVLDASGSMWGQIDGKPKLEIARQTLKTVLQSVPADLELGLIAYGHREKGSCSDIQLVVPPAAGTGGAIGAAADELKFLGKTPLSAAVEEAAKDLRYTEEKATVILITDGLETCNADPCAVATALEQSGIDFTAHIVGFGLTAEEGRQVACLAENTGGRYFQANDADALGKALTETVVQVQPTPAPEPVKEPEIEFNLMPTMTLAEGEPNVESGAIYEIHQIKADGTRGEWIKTGYDAWKDNLEPGDYMLVGRIDRAEVEQKLTVEAGKVAAPHVIMNAGRLKITPRGTEGGDIAEDASIVATYPGGEATEYGEHSFVLPAGDINLTVTLGKGVATLTVPLKAGETVSRDVVVGVGRAVVNAFYVAGMKVEDSNLFIEIVEAKKKIDGTRNSIAYEYGPDKGFDLPPGDYVATAKMQEAKAEAPLTVKTGQRTEVSVMLEAGVLAVTAPSARRLDVFAAKKDIQGKRVNLATEFGAAMQTTLNAGDYAVVSEQANGETVEQTVTVKAGERSELTFP